MIRLEPIDGSGDLTVALRLLSDGFPERSDAFWQQGFARAQASATRAGVPLGHILLSKGAPAGIILTFGSVRDGRAEPVVNLAAWYIAETARFLAPAMLKAVTSSPGLYTDLTPTASVARLSQALGFSALNDATAVIPLAAAGLLPGLNAELKPWRDAGLPDHLNQLAEEHETFDCMAFALGAGDREDLVVLRRTNYFRIAAAEVIYGDRRILREAIGPLARTLLLRGVMSLVYDCRDAEDALPYVAFRRAHNMRLIKGEPTGDLIDYAWSELPLLNP